MAKIYTKSRYMQARIERAAQYSPGALSGDSPERVDRVFGRRYTTFAPVDGMVQYRVREGETYQILAYRFYSDPMLWYVLADFNPQVYDVTELPIGENINVPPLTYAGLEFS